MESREKEILSLLDEDIKSLSEPLKETVTDIKKQGFSNYPILIAHEQDIAIAQKIIEKNVYNSNFSFSASTLEELVEKKVILEEKRKDFESMFRQSGDKVCFLLLHSEVMKFIFSPLK